MKQQIGNALLLTGDCLEVLRSLPECFRVNCCVTSPPYYGLRDYGNDGQIGLEPTPDEYVARLVEVFREVRRVLADDGTLWLNLGDSYAGGGGHSPNAPSSAYSKSGLYGDALISGGIKPRGVVKAKDLIGIPWRVAFALQQPYYTGQVKDERDRVWLAAMIDAEGSICGTEYQTGDRTKTNIYISVTNTSIPIIDKCERLFPQEVKHVYEKTNGVSNRQCFRWDVERMDTKSLFIREIYPYLVAKRKQAILAYTFIEMQRGLVSKKKGYLAEQHEQRSWLMTALSKLNSGEDVDLPDWTIEPPSLYEPGFYLRQDLIWHKPNPMPESVKDRCTKAHEYIFLLTKSARYWYDAEAVREQIKEGSGQNMRAPKLGDHRKDGNYETVTAKTYDEIKGANRRSVWTVATQPYAGAHFATFPPALIEPCILAGCPAGGTVLDPFSGSGTTGQVALQQGRKYVGIELNPEYQALAVERITPHAAQERLFA